MNTNSDDEIRPSESEIDDEIADLERRLAEAKSKHQQLTTSHPTSHSATPHHSQLSPSTPLSSPTNLHFLLLLSDSALPLGSFAFSSGLESYLAHQKLIFRQPCPPSAFTTSFLPLSLSSYASTALPFVLAAHRNQSTLAALDDAQDAVLVCTVARRASVAQGRALLGIWERSFAGAVKEEEDHHQGRGGGGNKGTAELRQFAALLRSSSSSSSPSTDDEPPPVAAHLAPLFGAVCALVGLGPEQTAYVSLLGHVKALVSAAVRAGMFGPYQAQKTLASGAVQRLIAALVEREWETPVERAGQNVPVMDLWAGRHEMLYSRIFNS